MVMSELHEAAFAGDLVAVEMCVAKGLNPSEGDPEWGDKTPLHLACGQGHKKCALVLLNAGANVNAVTEMGWTAGHFACETGKANCLTTLMLNGLDVEIQDYAGDTAKRVAEIYGKTECMKIIEDHENKRASARRPASPSSHRTGSTSNQQTVTPPRRTGLTGSQRPVRTVSPPPRRSGLVSNQRPVVRAVSPPHSTELASPQHGTKPAGGSVSDVPDSSSRGKQQQN